MILKELTIPYNLILLEILKRRLIHSHFKHPDLERDLARRWAGYWGEITLANYVKELPQDQYSIFHDLELQLNGIHFQIDTLLISQNYILIIEVKNILGTLVFDSVFNQLIRLKDDGTEETFEDPRVQAKRIKSLLTNWMVKNGLKLLPIEYLVFFSNVRTILKANPGDSTDLSKVCKARDVFNKIEQYEQVYKKVRVDSATISKMGRFLLDQHSPMQINILAKYNILEKDICSGVRCPNCSRIPMNYKWRKWTCPACNTSSKDAHIEALNDYFHLFKPTISNSEFRKFLHLPTNNIAHKILLSLHLQTTGKTKNRLYHQSKEKVNQCVF